MARRCWRRLSRLPAARARDTWHVSKEHMRASTTALPAPTSNTKESAAGPASAHKEHPKFRNCPKMSQSCSLNQQLMLPEAHVTRGSAHTCVMSSPHLFNALACSDHHNADPAGEQRYTVLRSRQTCCCAGARTCVMPSPHFCNALACSVPHAGHHNTDPVGEQRYTVLRSRLICCCAGARTCVISPPTIANPGMIWWMGAPR